MADTTALKNRIRAAIKANDNQEITGPVLQQSLLDIVDELNGATETEAQQRQSGDSTLQQGINTERQARIDADNALSQKINYQKENFDFFTVPGFVDKNGNFFQQNNFVRTPFLIVSPGDTIKIQAYSGGSTYDNYPIGAYYDADKHFISRTQEDVNLSSGDVELSLTVPAGAKYAVFNAKIDDTKRYVYSSLILYLNNILANIQLYDISSSQQLKNTINLSLRNKATQEILTQILIGSVTSQKAGLMSSDMFTLLYNLRNAGYAFGGIAVTDTNPGIPPASCFYIVRGAGTYTNFKNADNESIILENDGIYVLTYESVENNYWEYNLVIGVDGVLTPWSHNLIESGTVSFAIDDIIAKLLYDESILGIKEEITYDGYVGGSTWNMISGSYHKIFCVEPGDTVEITAQAQASHYAFLKHYTIEKTNGLRVSFTDGTTERILIPANTTVEVTAPADAKFLYVLYRYDNQTNYAPSSVKINDEEVLSSVKSYKELIDQLSLNLNNADVFSKIAINASYILPSSVFIGNIGGSGLNKWVGLTDPSTKFKLFPVNPGDSVYLYAGGTASGHYAFLKDYKIPVSGDIVPFCNGTSRQELGINQTITVTAPADAKFLYVLHTYDGRDFAFRSVKINDLEMLTDSFAKRMSECEHDVSGVKHVPADIGIVKDLVYNSPNTSFFGYIGGSWLYTGNKSYSYRLFPINPGDTVTIQTVTNNQGQYAFLKDYVFPVDGEAPLFCEGTSRETISSNTTVEVTAPADAKYLYILTKYNDIANWKPRKVLVNGKTCFFEISLLEYILQSQQNGESSGVLRYDSTNKSFEFISRIGLTDKYYSFIVSLEQDDSDIVYLKEWRLSGGYVYEFNGASLVRGVSILAAGENELATHFAGKADYTGGFHGDERIDVDASSFVKFFADGTLITDAMMQDDFAIPCKCFTYMQNSTLHETSNDGETPISGHPIIAYHYKKNVFCNGTSELVNKLKFASQQTVDQFHAGIWCTDQDSVSHAVLPTGQLVQLSKSHNSFASDNKKDSTVEYFGPIVHMTMYNRIVEGYDDETDIPAAYVLDWDRYAKYYRRTSSNKTFTQGSFIRNEQIVRYY